MPFDCLVFICDFKHFSLALSIPIKMLNAIENKTSTIIWHFHQKNVKNFHSLVQLKCRQIETRDECSIGTMLSSGKRFKFWIRKLLLIIARLRHFAYRNINMNYSERLLPFGLWIKFDSNELYIQRLHSILSTSCRFCGTFSISFAWLHSISLLNVWTRSMSVHNIRNGQPIQTISSRSTTMPMEKGEGKKNCRSWNEKKKREAKIQRWKRKYAEVQHGILCGCVHGIR